MAVFLRMVDELRSKEPNPTTILHHTRDATVVSVKTVKPEIRTARDQGFSPLPTETPIGDARHPRPSAPSSDSIGQTSSRTIAAGLAQWAFPRSVSFELPRYNGKHHYSTHPQQRKAATRTNRSRLGNSRFPLALSESATSARDTTGVSPLFAET